MRKMVLVFLWLSGISVWAQGSATLSGRVLDPQGNAVANAEVTLRSSLSGAAQMARTGDDGRYSFSDAAAGDYIVTVSAEGLAAQTRFIQVIAGNAEQAGDITLPLASVQQSITVVSASRVQELQQDSPQPVDLVTRQRIARTGFENVADVLGELPGVVTRNNASFSGSSQEQIDGVASQDVLVLQDGLPIVGARGINSGIIDLGEQNIGRLERVEVVRGAASSLYGTDAIGGVINMITREPAHPLEGGLRISGGNLGTADGDLDLGTQLKKFSAFTDLELHHRNSYTLIPDDESTVGANNQRYDALVKLRYAFDPRAAISYTADAYHNDSNGKSADFTGAAATGYDYAVSHDSTQTHALTGDFLPTTTTAIQARLYEARFDSNSSSNPIDADNSRGPQFDYGNLYERYHRADATISQQVKSWQYLQGGDEWVQDSYRGLNRIVGNDDGQQVTTNDVWLQDRIQPAKSLIVNLGGRYNHHSLYGSHVVPKVGVVYRINDRWTLRSAFGKGFRSPTLGELYYLLLHPEYGYQVLGNPTLEPERSESWSAGGDYQVNRYSIGVTLYRNNLNHLINYIFAGIPMSEAQLEALLAQYGIPLSFGAQPGLQTFVYTNVDQAYTQGINLKGSVLLNRNLRVDGFYAYLDPYDVTDKETLTERSRNSGYIRAEYVSNRFGFIANIRGNFFGRYLIQNAPVAREQAYALWNFYASKEIAHGLQAYGAIDNLGDSRDNLLSRNPPTYDRTDYGRTFRIGVKYIFPHE